MRKRRSRRNAWTLSVNLGTGVSMVSLCLALLGYGYSLAVESTFGIQSSLFADGALDYLRLSSHVVAFAIAASSENLVSAAFYASVYDRFGRYAWGATLLWALALLAWRQRRRLSGIATVVQGLRRHALLRAASGALERTWEACKWALVSLAAIWALLPAFASVLLALPILAAVLVAGVPLLGYEAGVRSLQQWVVEPEVCLQPRSRGQRMAQQPGASQAAGPGIRGVSCVAIREKGHPEAVQGRLVVATAQWAVLFDPDSGGVKRVAVQNAEIVPLGSLDARNTP